jgi:hypothetical protein
VVGLEALPSSIALGRFDDKAGVDVLVWQGNIAKIFALTSFFVDFPAKAKPTGHAVRVQRR